MSMLNYNPKSIITKLRLDPARLSNHTTGNKPSDIFYEVNNLLKEEKMNIPLANEEIEFLNEMNNNNWSVCQRYYYNGTWTDKGKYLIIEK